MKTMLIRPSLCKDNILPFMPLNIFVLGTYVENYTDVSIWDFPLEYGIPLTEKSYLQVFEKFRDDVLAEEPDIVGVSCTSGDEYIPTLRIANAVKEVLPSTTVVVGGYHAASCAEEMLTESSNIDCIAIGEGEESFKKIIQNRIDDKTSWDNVPGVMRFKDKKIMRTNAINIDVDKLPFISHDFMQMAQEYPTTAVELSRGCPFGCNFCQERIIRGKGWRMKNPKRAVEEIAYLAKNLGNENFMFYDVLFGISDEWTNQFCQEMVQKKTDINWMAMTRTSFDTDTLRAMGEAGARALFYGLESGSQKVLKLVNKIPGNKDYTDYLSISDKVFQDSARFGIVPIIGVIVGYPGETNQTMKETLNYLKGVVEKCRKISDAGVWIDPMYYLPLPKTPSTELMESYEGQFGSKQIINEWWKQDFPFINYFNTISVIPSKDVKTRDLERQKRSLTRLSRLSRKAQDNLFWSFSQRSDIQRIRDKMMKDTVFQTKDYLKIIKQKWENRGRTRRLWD